MMTISIGDALKAWRSTRKEKSGAAKIAAFNAAVRSNLDTYFLVPRVGCK
jgi:hypothetical protein